MASFATERSMCDLIFPIKLDWTRHVQKRAQSKSEGMAAQAVLYLAQNLDSYRVKTVWKCFFCARPQTDV